MVLLEKNFVLWHYGSMGVSTKKLNEQYDNV